MLEVKDNKLKIGKTVKDLKDVNLINGKEKSISFSNNMLERITEYPYTLDEVYSVLTNAGLQNFWLVNNTIVNLNNVEDVKIKYYQYAGLSIVESTKENAETCFINIICKNGKTESISFSSVKEAEYFNNTLTSLLFELKNSQLLKG